MIPGIFQAQVSLICLISELFTSPGHALPSVSQSPYRDSTITQRPCPVSVVFDVKSRTIFDELQQAVELTLGTGCASIKADLSEGNSEGY